MSGEKTRELDNLAKLFQTIRSRTTVYVDMTIGQFTKVWTSRRLKKTEQMNYKNSPQQI